jgi:hypothetical protein
MLKTSVVAAVILVLAGCASSAGPIEQRTTQGPNAQEFFVNRTLLENGREPSFEERRHWDNQIEDKISVYLREHPEVANSLGVSTFRFDRRAAIGMSKEQVVILLGEAALTTTDPAAMEKLARQYWPAVRARKVTEAWSYPGGWHLYFAEEKLADITQYYDKQ